ncbi:hypothetical protein [Parvularcula sp. LCG005]|uniref:hypothetical protein n=1 Tax=Parvularcula sp. LCG005 TaxID=3078805 RepID=UPI0029433C85|nr:hypothetical protein [Parvularcula sp. LCG005]WOI54395.1 hypothetical protein RUI03_05175 [Parvularcula sp. LCG005]
MERPTHSPEVVVDDEKPILIYVLYLVALVTAVPFFLGVILAYVFKSRAPAWARSHYEHQISLFWRFLLGNIVLGILFAIAMPLSFILIGIPLMAVAGIAWVYLWIWMLFRCLKGIQSARLDEDYRGNWGWRI